jgi:hypothetical protein
MPEKPPLFLAKCFFIDYEDLTVRVRYEQFDRELDSIQVPYQLKLVSQIPFLRSIDNDLNTHFLGLSNIIADNKRLSPRRCDLLRVVP